VTHRWTGWRWTSAEALLLDEAEVPPRLFRTPWSFALLQLLAGVDHVQIFLAARAARDHSHDEPVIHFTFNVGPKPGTAFNAADEQLWLWRSQPSQASFANARAGSKAP